MVTTSSHSEADHLDQQQLPNVGSKDFEGGGGAEYVGNVALNFPTNSKGHIYIDI